jgi:hypothetical protein
MYGFGAIVTFFLMRAGLWNWEYHFDNTDSVLMTIFIFYTASGIVAGWKTLTTITPQIFLFLPVLGWLLYFLVKLALAFFVGLVMLPIRTVVCIVQLNKLKTAK